MAELLQLPELDSVQCTVDYVLGISVDEDVSLTRPGTGAPAQNAPVFLGSVM